jgi:hypothetical protein
MNLSKVSILIMSDKIPDFSKQVSDSLAHKTFQKLIFHKPKNGLFYKSMMETFIDKKNELKLKISNYTKTQDFTETYPIESLTHIIGEKLDQFFFADLFTTSYDLFFKQSKKGQITITRKNKIEDILPTKELNNHNHKKEYLIDSSSSYLYDLGITTQNSQVKPSMFHKFKQINRFIEIISHHVHIKGKNPVIADMGSGKGYLTFALHSYFTQQEHTAPKITGYELRDELVNICNTISDKYQLQGLRFEAGDIIEKELKEVDMLIALHACDIATDIAIQKGIQSNASYIILSPCCHKQIRKEITLKNDITKYGIFEERMAEMITDTIRTLILNNFGYKTNIIEYISSEHTSKNTMIIAEFTNIQDHKALDKVAQLKNQYGINHHYLEKLLEL